MEETHDIPPPAYSLVDDRTAPPPSSRPQSLPVDERPPPLPPRTPSVLSAAGSKYTGYTDHPSYPSYPDDTPPPPPPHRILSVGSSRSVRPGESSEDTPPRLPPRPPTISTAQSSDYVRLTHERSMSTASYNPRGMDNSYSPRDIDSSYNPRGMDNSSYYGHEKSPSQTIQSPVSAEYQQHIYSQIGVQSSSARDAAPLNRKRKLLLVYIHGFLGNTTSFNQLPTHLHNLLTYFLSISCPQYTVHTKVYPRFKTRHAIGDAAEMFSQWLADHEGDDTDIVLLGHSMGGILAGEVVLLPPMHAYGDSGSERRYRHKIMGLVGFDVPFLGMHPGIITSGISSLFRPGDKRKTSAPPPPASPVTGKMSSAKVENHDEGPSAEDLFQLQNPQHFNTGLNRPIRGSGPIVNSEGGGALGGVWNFVNKHRGNVPGATMQYVLSHMEFAACLADPMGLNSRYKRLKSLELANAATGNYRVRFINYYTVCYGREKEETRQTTSGALSPTISGTADLTPATSRSSSHVRQDSRNSLGTPPNNNTLSVESALRPRTPETNSRGPNYQSIDNPNLSPKSEQGSFHSARSSIDSHSSELNLPPSGVVALVSSSPQPPQSPYQNTQGLDAAGQLSPRSPAILIDSNDLNARSARYSLPSLPPAPIPPPLHPELSHITDPKVQKAHMKENKRLWKEHLRQEKVHRKLIKEREKVLSKLEAKDVAFGGNSTQQPFIVPAASGGSDSRPSSSQLNAVDKKPKIKKERKFCLIPREAQAPEDGSQAPTSVTDEFWVKVPMHNTDEVGAHCGLFLAGVEIMDNSSSSSKNTVMTQPHDAGPVDGISSGPELNAEGAAGGSGSSRPPVNDEEIAEQRELEIKRRGYEKLVGDVGARIEAWVKEHAGTLEAMELAGAQAKWEYSEDRKTAY
ncbi:hypothetical protein DFH27DRAFT_564521 [Peziza echinospora]|nr:hypothetical protein DFH27DRAFT_564521 [Peziza echinospora]